MGSTHLIPLHSLERQIRLKTRGKGRQVEPGALQDVLALLGDAPRRRDLLIEHLHRIQDAYGRLADGHLVALAREMNLSMAEVYEVATFYHHFDVVRDAGSGTPDPAAKLTVRVCESLACELAGAGDLIKRLPALLGTGVKVIGAPCVGRCEQAPVVVVGQNPLPRARCADVKAAVAAGAVSHPVADDRKGFDPLTFLDPKRSPGPGALVAPAYAGYVAYRKAGGYRLLAECLAGGHDAETMIGKMEDSGLRGLGGAGFPAGRK